MSDYSIIVILQTLITTVGVIATLVLTILIFFLVRTDSMYDNIRKIQNMIDNPERKEKLTLAIDKARMLANLDYQKTFVRQFFKVLITLIIVFVFSLITLTLKMSFPITIIETVVYILVIAAISGFLLMFYYFYYLLRYNGLIGDDFLVLKHLFYKGALWKICTAPLLSSSV